MKKNFSKCMKLMTLSALILSFSLSPSLARAADTIEEYAPGQLAFELGFSGEYLRAGMKDGAHNALFMSDIVVGYGIMRYLSAQVGMTFMSDGRLGTMLPGYPSWSGKLISTVLDTQMFDLDLMLGFNGWALPGLELNIDFMPNMGAYLRGTMPLYGVEKYSDGEYGTGLSMNFMLEPGFYVKLHEIHQLFLELNFEFNVRDGSGDDSDAAGYLGSRIAFGYNVKVLENFKFMADVHLLAMKDEDVDFGVTIGFKSTLPVWK